MKSKLLEQVNIKMKSERYSKSTIELYTNWILRFIIFNNKTHPLELTKTNIEKYLTYLAVEKKVYASTQNQALAAILYLYKKIVVKDVGWLDDVVRARKSRRLPVVFTKAEVIDVFKHLEGTPKLICSLLYGSGLPLGEALNLRVKDINFDNRQSSLLLSLKKYPNADKDFYWQYVFPADKFIKDENGLVLRFHIHESTIQRAIKEAVGKAKILKHGTAHTFRHSFVTHLLENGYDIRTIYPVRYAI